jgi:hypothetical protein
MQLYKRPGHGQERSQYIIKQLRDKYGQDLEDPDPEEVLARLDEGGDGLDEVRAGRAVESCVSLGCYKHSDK